MFVGTDVCVQMAFVWEETGVPGGNPPVWFSDDMTISLSQHAKPIQFRNSAPRPLTTLTASTNPDLTKILVE